MVAKFAEVRIEINGQQIIFVIWDNSGAKRFRTIKRSYYIIGLIEMDSFNSLNNWYDEIHNSNLLVDVPVVLVGNKIDDELSHRAVSFEETQQDALKFGWKYFDVPAKTNL